MIQFLDLPKVIEGKEKEVSEWLVVVAEGYRSRIKGLVYHFVDDEEVTRINVEHLDHDYATDIITFGYEEGKRVRGEIYIGYETVFENANDLGLSAVDELCRVIAHGLLHLIGFDDHTDEEKRLMRSEEEKCLILRPKILRGN